MRLLSPAISLCALTACSCGAATVSPPPPTTVAAPHTPSFEVHEWGLVRGTIDDHVMISGPHAPEPVVVMAKPVLYFHREAPTDGETALEVDVEVTIPDGRVVEHWPSQNPPGATISWNDVLVQDGSCRGSRYPTAGEPPCLGLADGCEAATLASVETLDSDCLSWPAPPGDDGPTESWNHLFYRAERDTAPPLPLRLAPQPDGTLRITATGSERVPGRLLRVLRANGNAGVTDGASIGDAPAPGASTVLAAPTGSLADAAEALAASLRDAGLTADEIAAFRRAWDEPLFGIRPLASADVPTVTATLTTASPMVPPAPRTSVIYVLPLSSADALATLHITPAPTVLRRAIVIWLDETAAP